MAANEKLLAADDAGEEDDGDAAGADSSAQVSDLTDALGKVRHTMQEHWLYMVLARMLSSGPRTIQTLSSSSCTWRSWKGMWESCCGMGGQLCIRAEVMSVSPRHWCCQVSEDSWGAIICHLMPTE